MATRTSKRAVAEANANEIVDQLASLESLLSDADEDTIKALRPKLMAIEAEQMYGITANAPRTTYGSWSLNTTDLMRPIRAIYFDNIELDWTEDEILERFDKAKAGK